MAGRGWGETHLVPYIWDTGYMVHCQFYIMLRLRGGKWTNLQQIEFFSQYQD